ncbi:hypothetical protein Lal_00018023 [Lupinus albus]|nr:hypothetical protein Lal_00018023 [Lupinus albus]
MIALEITSEKASWLRSLHAEIPLWEKQIPVVVDHVRSENNLANPLTKKVLAREKVHNTSKSMKLLPLERRSLMVVT